MAEPAEKVEVIRSYSDHTIHAEVGSIIRKHSENKNDIRLIIRDVIDWPATRNILDLGCGYGWFEEIVPDGLDMIGGIDCLEENREPFLKAARKKSRDSFFKVLTLPAPTGLESGCFDLIVSLYSIYFFPGSLAEIKRLVKPGGLFVCLTHSSSMLEEGEHYFDFRNLRKIIEHFCAENGESLLKRFFSRINHIDYPNSLVFHRGEESSLAMYIDFKKEFIEKDVDPGIVREKMIQELRKKGELRFNKNDRIFLAKI